MSGQEQQSAIGQREEGLGDMTGMEAGNAAAAPAGETGGAEEELTAMARRMRALRNDESLHPAVRKAVGNRLRYVSPLNGRVVVSHRYELPVLFTVNNDQDRIHINHLKGRFYEHNQLAVMKGYFPEGGTFMDVGANIGNHMLYMLLLGGAARVLPVEPNPKAISLLVSNIILNGLTDRVDFSTLGCGLDAEDGDGLAIHSPRDNLGWAKLKPVGEARGDGTAVPVRRGDALVGETHVDFIKIDVEGMEIGALKGLEQTILRCRPHLFVELENVNREPFFAMMSAWGYEVAEDFKANNINQNLLLRPLPAGEGL